MSLDARCDECRKEVEVGGVLYCEACWDRGAMAAAERLTRAVGDAKSDAYAEGFQAGRMIGYEQGKTAQIFGDEPDAPTAGGGGGE